MSFLSYIYYFSSTSYVSSKLLYVIHVIVF